MKKKKEKIEIGQPIIWLDTNLTKWEKSFNIKPAIKIIDTNYLTLDLVINIYKIRFWFGIGIFLWYR